MRTSAEIREIEKQAVDYCRAKGLRLTKGRIDVLKQVAARRRPVKAYDLIASSAGGDKKPMPPIIYRALDFWTAHGFIHRIESLNAYTCCTHPGCRHECQLFVCSQCDRVFEMCSESVAEKLFAAARMQGFEVEQFKLEARGRCPSCR